MHRALRLSVCGALVPLALVVACTSVQAQSPDVATNGQPVVYGQDDRRDVYQVSDDAIRTLATESVVTLVNRSALNATDPNQVRFAAATLGQNFDLCAGEAFADQPAAGFCSGSLIGPDLVLTAGHCINDASCSRVSFVFGYHMAAAGRLNTVTTQDIFSCARVVARVESDALDYAVVQLDRSASPRFTPATVRVGPPLAAGTPLVMIGSPSGLPVKIDDGGAVRTPQQGNYLIATTDSFGGNSGSAVWEANSLDIIGILTAGETDYVQDGNCTRANVCSETGCDGEDVLYVAPAINAFCQVGTDESLCGSAARCGDGYCAYNENASSCAADCNAVGCGDGVCGVSEWATCDQDCRIVIPDGWECDPSFYGTGDGCDCNCGSVEDPDCGDPGQERINCDDALCAALPAGGRQDFPVSNVWLLLAALVGGQAGRRLFRTRTPVQHS